VTITYPEDGVDQVIDPQDESWIFLQLAASLASQIPFFQGFAIKRVAAALPVELGWQIPYLGIYHIGEEGTPLGDWDIGAVKFRTNFTMGFQIIVKDNDPATCAATLAKAKAELLNGLLNSNAFTNMLQSKASDAGVTAEGFPRYRVKPPRWGKAGTNETPVGEQQIELQMRYPTFYYPRNFADLNEIHVTTGFPGPGSTPEEQAEIQQVTIVYDFVTPLWTEQPPTLSTPPPAAGANP
jgi:hypothetical protein